MKTISQIIPTALAGALAAPAASEASIRRASSWILAQSGFHLTGTETAEEVEMLEKAFREASEFLAEVIDLMEPRWLTIVGQSGTGKTLMASAVAKYISEFGASVFNRETEKLGLQEHGRIYSYAQRQHPFRRWSDICQVPSNNAAKESACCDRLVVIDELKPQFGEPAKFKSKNKSGETIEQTSVAPKTFERTLADDIFDRRIRKWTVITCNMSPSEISALWGARIISRMARHNSKLIDLTGVRDYAVRKKEALEKLK